MFNRAFNMAFNKACWSLLAPLALFAGVATAHEPGEPVRSIVLIGVAGEWDATILSSGRYGGTIAMEIEPIDGWLEIEMGLAAVASGGRTELGAELVFKKPWVISPQFEIMAGLGPSLTHHFNGTERGTFYAIEFALHLAFWPAKKVGWYVEPTYGVGLGKNKEKRFGTTAGVLIRW